MLTVKLIFVPSSVIFSITLETYLLLPVALTLKAEPMLSVSVAFVPAGNLLMLVATVCSTSDIFVDVTILTVLFVEMPFNISIASVLSKL